MNGTRSSRSRKVLGPERSDFERAAGELLTVIKEEDRVLAIAKHIPIPWLGNDKAVIAAIIARPGRVLSVLVLGKIDDRSPIHLGGNCAVTGTYPAMWWGNSSTLHRMRQGAVNKGKPKSW